MKSQDKWYEIHTTNMHALSDQLIIKFPQQNCCGDMVIAWQFKFKNQIFI